MNLLARDLLSKRSLYEEVAASLSRMVEEGFFRPSVP